MALNQAENIELSILRLMDTCLLWVTIQLYKGDMQQLNEAEKREMRNTRATLANQEEDYIRV